MARSTKVAQKMPEIKSVCHNKIKGKVLEKEKMKMIWMTMMNRKFRLLVGKKVVEDFWTHISFQNRLDCLMLIVGVGGAELSPQTEIVLKNPKKYLLILILLRIPKLCQLTPSFRRLSSPGPLQFCD